MRCDVMLTYFFSGRSATRSILRLRRTYTIPDCAAQALPYALYITGYRVDYWIFQPGQDHGSEKGKKWFGLK
jgi:hypothetical protein